MSRETLRCFWPSPGEGQVSLATGSDKGAQGFKASQKKSGGREERKKEEEEEDEGGGERKKMRDVERKGGEKKRRKKRREFNKPQVWISQVPFKWSQTATRWRSRLPLMSNHQEGGMTKPPDCSNCNRLQKKQRTVEPREPQRVSNTAPPPAFRR